MKTVDELFALSTRFLVEEFDPFVRQHGAAPAEAAALLTIMLGRLVGAQGYRHMSSELYWEEIMKNGKPLYVLGFESERKKES